MLASLSTNTRLARKPQKDSIRNGADHSRHHLLAASDAFLRSCAGLSSAATPAYDEPRSREFSLVHMMVST